MAAEESKKTWWQRHIWDNSDQPDKPPGTRFGRFLRKNWSEAGMIRRTFFLIMVFITVNFLATFCCCGCFSIVGFFVDREISDDQKSIHRPQSEDDPHKKPEDKDGKDKEGKIVPPIPPDKGGKKFEEVFDLPKEGGKEHKLKSGVVITSWGEMEHRKENEQYMIFFGKGGTPIFLVKNGGKEAIKLGVSSAEEDGNLRNTVLQLEPGGSYQLKLYPWMGQQNWTCNISMQQVEKKKK